MRQTSKILSMLLAVAMLLPSQALAADGALEDAASKSTVVINEVESDAPNKGNDWVEIANIGSEAVDLSGWYLTDNKGEERKTEGETTPLAERTVLEPGAFLVLEETVNFDFGLGKADTAILYDETESRSTAMPIPAWQPARGPGRPMAALPMRKPPRARQTQRLPRRNRIPPLQSQRWCSTRSTPAPMIGWN